MRPKIQIGLLVLATLMASNIAFAKKFPLTADASVPAARGQVDVGKDKNGNTEVEVKYLAPPENLTPPKSSYIVWFQERGGEPTVQGQLRMNKKLNGSFKTTTPLKTFDVFITAESEGTPKTPTGPQVLRASVQP
jgi:hypothetical protein